MNTIGYPMTGTLIRSNPSTLTNGETTMSRVLFEKPVAMAIAALLQDASKELGRLSWGIDEVLKQDRNGTPVDDKIADTVFKRAFVAYAAISDALEGLAHQGVINSPGEGTLSLVEAAGLTREPEPVVVKPDIKKGVH